jgi:hypothetical protein
MCPLTAYPTWTEKAIRLARDETLVKNLRI